MLDNLNVFGSFTHTDAVLLTIFGMWLILKWGNWLPETEGVRKVVNLLNDRGGNLAQLLFLTVYFFKWAMWLFIFTMQQVSAGKFDKTDAIILQALTFVTGTAFGGAWGAYLKTMTGSDSSSRASDGRAPQAQLTLTATQDLPGSPPQFPHVKNVLS